MYSFFFIPFLLPYFAIALCSQPPDSLCPFPDGEQPVYLPHEECNKYYQCSNGHAYEMQCPLGTVFNPQLNVCDYPCNVHCTNKSPPVFYDNTESKVEIEEAIIVVEQTISDEELGIEICSAKPNESFFAQHQFNCKKYIACEQGVATISECFGSLHYSARFGVCIGAQHAECRLRA